MSGTLRVPPGFKVVEAPDGTVEVVKGDERLSRTVSFRLTPSEYVELMPFIDTFTNGSVTEAFRWLMADPAVKSAMTRRVQSSRSKK